MVHIVPSISFVREVKDKLEQGFSLSRALEVTIQGNSDSFSNKMHFWRENFKNGVDKQSEIFSSHFQWSCIEILKAGLQGAPVHEHLQQLEVEMTEEFERLWKVHLESLPSKLSIPLLLFYFPAYIILLFGPLLKQFLLEVP